MDNFQRASRRADALARRLITTIPAEQVAEGMATSGIALGMTIWGRADTVAWLRALADGLEARP